MRILILFILLTASSCGLFRKSSKQVHEIKSSSQVERVEERKDTSHTQTSSNRQTTTSASLEGSHVTKIVADELIIGVDGSIKAKGNVKSTTHGKVATTEHREETEKVDSSTISTAEVSLKEITKESEKVKDIDKKSEPIKVNWLAFLGFVIAIVSLILLIKNKKT